MDPPVSSKVYTRSSSDDSSRVAPRGDFSCSVQEISHSLDSWKERRKLGLGSRAQRGLLRFQEPVRHSIVRAVSDDPAGAGETRETDGEEEEEEESTPAQQRRHTNVPSTVGIDKNALSSHKRSDNQRSCSSSNTSSSSDVSTHPTTPAFFPSSQRYHHQHRHDNDGEKAEESKATEKRESVVKQTTNSEIRTTQSIIPTTTTTTNNNTNTTTTSTSTDKSGVVSQPGVELGFTSSSSSSSPSLSSSPSSIFHHHRPASPVSDRPLSLLSKRSDCSTTLLLSSSKSSASSSRDHDGGDSVLCRDANGGAERCALHSSCGKRTATGDAPLVEGVQRNAEYDCVVDCSVDDRNNSNAVVLDGEDTTSSQKKDSSARDVDVVYIETPGNNTNDQQTNSMIHNLENDEMWDVDLTAIEATQTLNNENARQKLLLRRKSSLAQRQRPTRTRKRFSDSESESESSSLNVESVTYEKKKTRDIYYVDLPETADEYKSSTGTSSKVRTELSEAPFQNVLKGRRDGRKDPGLQLKKEKDHENRAVLDTTPVVLRNNSYNSFDNTAGNRKPLSQDISFDGSKVDIPEKVTPFGNVTTRSPRHHEFLRGSRSLASSEDLTDRLDSSLTHVGSENYRNRLRNSDSSKETHRKSFPNVDIQPAVLRSTTRRIFEDGPKTTVNTEDDWLNKRRSTPIITTASTTAPIKDSSSCTDSNGDQIPEKWSVIRQPLDSGTDNRNTQNVTERPPWIKKNLDQRRTSSYSFTPIPTKELDSKESNEPPWIKEFRNSRKRVGRIFSNREPVKTGSDKPQSSSFETTQPARIAKPLSSIAGEQSSREVVGRKLSLNASPSSTAAEKKEAPNIQSDGSTSPKYKVERKLSINSTNEGDVSSRMKENRSPVTRNSINTAEPYLPSWSVAGAGEAPASLVDSRGDIPDWQRKLAEKNKLRKQSFRRTKSEGSELYEDYDLDSTLEESYLEDEKEKVPAMYSQNNEPYAPSGSYPQASASVPDVNSYQGQWYVPQPQQGYYEGYDPNYYYGCNQQSAGYAGSYTAPYVQTAEYNQHDMSYNQNQYAPLNRAHSYDALNQYEGFTTTEESTQISKLSLSPKHNEHSDSRTASPKSPRFVRVLPPSISNGPSPSTSPRKSNISECSSAPHSPASSASYRPACSPAGSPVAQKSPHKGLPTFSLSNAESQSDGHLKPYSSKPMYVRVLPPPNLPNKLSPRKRREYTDLSPDNSPSRIPVAIKEATDGSTPKSLTKRLFGRKQEGSGSNASNFSPDDSDKKPKTKYKLKIPVSPKFSPFKKKDKTPKHSQSDDESNSSLSIPATPKHNVTAQANAANKLPSNEPEKGPYYRILRSPLKGKSQGKGTPPSYSMTFPYEEVCERRAKLRPVLSMEPNTTQSPTTPERNTPIFKRGRRIEDSSSSKGSTDDGSPKAQPAWRHQLKNRTSLSMVEQGEQKSSEKPDWIKQAEERRARLAKNKMLGD